MFAPRALSRALYAPTSYHQVRTPTALSVTVRRQVFARPMANLRLKETPEERAERQWRKARKAERKARRQSHHVAADEQPPPRKRRRTEDSGYNDGEGWIPPETATKVDADQIRAEVEERMFREKLFDAMHDDYENRLDDLETHFNGYGHIPNRWKAAGSGDHGHFNHMTANPDEMGHEEYAEWIREGMWRRTHKAEMEERDRKRAERDARKKQQRKAKEEAARIDREREMKRKLKHEIKEKHRLREAWGYYETRWKAHSTEEAQDATIKFQDVPWPIFSVARTPEDLTSERISEFLLYDIDGQDDGGSTAPRKKTRKERVREALLRWHPDKFEGKMGSRIDINEMSMVMNGVGIVARCLNSMMTA